MISDILVYTSLKEGHTDIFRLTNTGTSTIVSNHSIKKVLEKKEKTGMIKWIMQCNSFIINIKSNIFGIKLLHFVDKKTLTFEVQQYIVGILNIVISFHWDDIEIPIASCIIFPQNHFSNFETIDTEIIDETY